MPYKKGDKFTVAITEVLTGDDGRLAYRLNDMPNLVVDVNQLNDLEQETTAEPEKKSPFSRVGYGNEYFTIQTGGCVTTGVDTEGSVDCARFETANYCTDKSLIEQRALHETLNRLLWRYSAEHGGDHSQWGPGSKHWFIFKDSRGDIRISLNDDFHVYGVPYFSTENLAFNAIYDIVEPFMAEHPEFVW